MGRLAVARTKARRGKSAPIWAKKYEAGEQVEVQWVRLDEQWRKVKFWKSAIVSKVDAEGVTVTLTPAGQITVAGSKHIRKVAA